MSLNNRYYSVLKSDVSAPSGITFTPELMPLLSDLFYVDYWVVCQAKEYQVRVNLTGIQHSTDIGETWGAEITFDTSEVNSAYCFDNGKYILIGQTKLWYGDANTSSAPTLITVKDTDGTTDYIPHTPQNPLYPGNYYIPYDWTAPQYDSQGNQFLVWGNYCNVNRGAAPVNIYLARPDGTVKVTYKFGVNPDESDDGTEQGGVGGTLLGDPTNNVLTRHVHSTGFSNEAQKAIICCGDAYEAGAFDRQWLRGTFDDTDFTWEVLPQFDVEGAAHLSTTLTGIGDDMYFGMGTDQGAIKGFWKAPIDTIEDESTHVKIFDYPDDGNAYAHTGGMIDKDFGVLMGSMRFGTTWLTAESVYSGLVTSGEYYISNRMIPFRFSQMNYKNDNGYYLYYIEQFDANQSGCLFYRPGRDLFQSLV